MKSRRDTTKLIHEILMLARAGASKYQMISRIGLNSPQASSYISFLIANGHMQQWLDVDGKRKYHLTAKGERLVYFLALVQKELAGLFPKPGPSPYQVSHEIFMPQLYPEQDPARRSSA